MHKKKGFSAALIGTDFEDPFRTNYFEIRWQLYCSTIDLKSSTR